MPASTTRQQLRRALGDVHYPAEKDRLVDRALVNGADEQTVRAIPPVEYRSLSEVLSSMPLRDEEDTVSPSHQAQAQAQAQRTHTKPGLAESAKEVSSPNPIIEELGTNRGS
jgi:Protein of unknown function (DUF2795)